LFASFGYVLLFTPNISQHTYHSIDPFTSSATITRAVSRRDKHIMADMQDNRPGEEEEEEEEEIDESVRFKEKSFLNWW